MILIKDKLKALTVYSSLGLILTQYYKIAFVITLLNCQICRRLNRGVTKKVCRKCQFKNKQLIYSSWYLMMIHCGKICYMRKNSWYPSRQRCAIFNSKIYKPKTCSSFWMRSLISLGSKIRLKRQIPLKKICKQICN